MLRLSSRVSRSINLFTRYTIKNTPPYYYQYADKKEITKAFRRQAQQCHPDVNKSPSAYAKFIEINMARQILSNPNKKEDYDYLQCLDSSSFYNGSNFQIYCWSVQKQFVWIPIKQEDFIPKQLDLYISEFERITGCTKTIKYHRYVVCPSCKGKVYYGCIFCNRLSYIIEGYKEDIQIPKGADLSQPIILQGRGDFGGKLIVFLLINRRTQFTRIGKYAWKDLYVSALDAFTGAYIKVYDVEGRQFELQIEAGTQHNQEIYVSQRGNLYQHKKNRSLRIYRGPLIFIIKIYVPNQLNEQEKNVIRSIKERLIKTKSEKDMQQYEDREFKKQKKYYDKEDDDF